MYNVVINQISLVKVLFILSVVSEVHYTLAYYNLTNVNIMKECFQRELMNDDGEQILTLQKIFLFPRSADGLCFTVNVTMEFERSRITDSSVQCTTGIGEANLRTESYTFVFQLSPAAPQADTDLIKALSSPTIKWMLTLLDPFFYLVLLSSLFSTGYYDYAEDYAEYYASVTVIEFRVQLYGIDSLGGIYSDVTDAIYSTLSWAKAYSKNQGPLNQTLEDISWLKHVSSCSDISQVQDPKSIADPIFCIYVLVNILILLFTVRYSGKVYTWTEIEYFKNLFKASAIVLAFINLGTFILNTVLAVVYYNINNRTHLIIKYILVILIFILDIIVSYHNTRTYSHIKCKIMYALALCQIIWFVHRLATYVILFILAFLVAPAQALGILSLLLTVIFFTILFVSSLLKQCQAGCSRRSCSNGGTLLAMLLRIFILVCTAGLVFTVIYLFVILVNSGLHSAGLGGFILSLVTPTIFFVIGIYINHETAINFYHQVLSSKSTSSGKSVDEKDEETGVPDGHPNNDAMTVIRTSKVSIDMEGSEVKDPELV